MKLQKKWARVYKPNVYVLNKVSSNMLTQILMYFSARLKYNTGFSKGPQKLTFHCLV